MAKVSIIIPVYNTSEYLERCLDSVLRQTLEDIEIICVNDGSTDNSLDMLRRYQDRDCRIKIIDKPNGGLVSARKAGIEGAGSEYIGYVDSDDWIDDDMYERLYGYMTRTGADLVSSGYKYEGNYITQHYDTVPEGFYDEERMDGLREQVIYNIEKKDVGIRGSLCCKLFKKDLLSVAQNCIEDSISYSEDKLCVVRYMLDCKTVFIAREAYYHYMQNNSSMVHKPNANYLTAVNAVYQHFISMYDHPNFTSSMRMQAELYITELLYKGINSRLGFENKNLLWIKPYYLEKIPHNSKLILFGAGELGDIYKKQILNDGRSSIIAVMDTSFRIVYSVDSDFTSPEDLAGIDYDYILITVKNKVKSAEIKRELAGRGVPENKLLWFEQQEIFWDFAEADGWI